MPSYGQADIVFTVGGTAMQGHIMNIGDFNIEAITEESDSFGDSWVENVYVGVKRAPAFEVSGIYDDTAVSGPNAIFNAVGTTVAVVITWGGTKTSTGSCIIQQFRRSPSRGAKTKYSATLLPTGAVVEA